MGASADDALRGGPRCVKCRVAPAVGGPSRGARCSVDSDLADALESLKTVFAKRKIAATFGKAPADRVDALKKQLRVPSRYRAFLLGADPLKVETVTPVERVRLFPSDEIEKAQAAVR